MSPVPLTVCFLSVLMVLVIHWVPVACQPRSGPGKPCQRARARVSTVILSSSQPAHFQTQTKTSEAWF